MKSQSSVPQQNARGVTSMVTGIHARSLADAARRGGVNYLCGPFIGPDVEIPQPMIRLSWRELLNRDGVEGRRRAC